MSISISIVHHEGGDSVLRADVYHLDRYGQPGQVPRLSQEISPGVPAIVRLVPNDVLVVRELQPSGGDVEAGDQDGADDIDQTAGERA
jgi:hypothetical protein